LIFPTENDGRFLSWMTAVPTLGLFVAGLGAVAANGGGLFQYSATVLLGSGLLYCASRQILIRSRIAARQLLKATIIYLLLQFMILILRKG
jgi:heme O synthase-like polyprenyltransferase